MENSGCRMHYTGDRPHNSYGRISMISKWKSSYLIEFCLLSNDPCQYQLYFPHGTFINSIFLSITPHENKNWWLFIYTDNFKSLNVVLRWTMNLGIKNLRFFFCDVVTLHFISPLKSSTIWRDLRQKRRDRREARPGQRGTARIQSNIGINCRQQKR